VNDRETRTPAEPSGGTRAATAAAKPAAQAAARSMVRPRATSTCPTSSDAAANTAPAAARAATSQLGRNSAPKRRLTAGGPSKPPPTAAIGLRTRAPTTNRCAHRRSKSSRPAAAKEVKGGSSLASRFWVITMGRRNSWKVTKTTLISPGSSLRMPTAMGASSRRT
jgi:hypothetical protein